MAEPVTNERLYEVLKSLQEGETQLRRELGEIRAEMRSTDVHLATFSSSYAVIVGDGVRRADQPADFGARVERIECRPERTAPSI